MLAEPTCFVIKYAYTEAWRIKCQKLNLYGRTLIPLPLPKLVVFYNGEDEKEDETVLRLSDAFKKEIRQNLIRKHIENNTEPDAAALSAETERIFQNAGPDIEVTVRMLNINHGHNSRMLSACRPLGEYAWLVARARKNIEADKKAAGPLPLVMPLTG